MLELAVRQPEQVRRWHDESNNLVVLSVADEGELTLLASRHPDAITFTEPDLGGELTAIAFTPGGAPESLSNLPLAGREVVMA